MTDLSPAAQAVLDAYRSIWLDEPMDTDVECLAVALRVAVDQVVPLTLEEEFFCRNHSLSLQKMVEIRLQLLAIADELEKTNG